LADTRAKLATAEQTIAAQKAHQTRVRRPITRNGSTAEGDAAEARAAESSTAISYAAGAAQRFHRGRRGGAADTSQTGEARSISSWRVRLADENVNLASGGSNLDAKVAAPENAPFEDMLAPELVFTKDKIRTRTGD